MNITQNKTKQNKMKIHSHNFKIYFLLSYYLYLLICTIDLLVIENELMKIDNLVFHYLKFTLILYSLFGIILITMIISNVIYYSKYNVLKDNDIGCMLILITPDLILNATYFFFSVRFKEYKEDYIDNTLFRFYIIPKLILGLILLFIYLGLCIIFLIYMLDVCCFSKIIYNTISYCKGERKTICNYNSDDDTNINGII